MQEGPGSCRAIDQQATYPRLAHPDERREVFAASGGTIMQQCERLRLLRRSFLKVAGGYVLMHSSGRAAVQFFQAGEQTVKGASLNEAKKSKIKIAQIKVVPAKGQLQANHRLLMEVLGEIAKVPDLDVVITPEGFLDGYVSTE
jgi:hypothetical protein